MTKKIINKIYLIMAKTAFSILTYTIFYVIYNVYSKLLILAIFIGWNILLDIFVVLTNKIKEIK